MTSYKHLYIQLIPYFLFFVCVHCKYEELNNRPIIGIVGQHLRRPTPGIKGSSYVIASYVKFLEGAGARVVPLPTSLSEEELKELFTKINGVLLPGGTCAFQTSKYYQHAALLFKWAVKAMQTGDYFPIWGTCMGFETLAEIVAGTDKIMSESQAGGFAWPLNFTDNAEKSRMFAGMSPNLKKLIQIENLTFNAHLNCVTHDTYEKNRRLKDFFNVLTLNSDAHGTTFVSTIEGLYFVLI